ncbi:MAG: hypothetical protein J6334_01715, partial [Kiritimatiellae bacterium]|nr:hypothetical protein [Kiritimatiellia bacterium]
MMTATGRWMTAVFTAIALCLGVYAGNGDGRTLGGGSDTKPVEYGALQGDGTDRSYAITWKNGEGTVIDVTTVAYGRIPTHAGVTEPATGDLRYIFNGWSPTPVPVTGDAVYTATFRERDMGGQGPVCVAHLSFDDYGNDGLNVLKATVGGDAIVRTTPVNVVEGLGAVTCVTDPAILAGLPEGDGAVAIPLRTHLILPIPGELSNVDAHPYSILMKVKFPSFGPYYAIINMPASNDVDDFVFLSNSSTPHIVFKMMGGATSNRIEGRGEGLFKAGEWETLLFLFDRDKTRVLLNGQEIFAYACSLSASRGNCANAGGYFILSGDNDGEDPLIYWADVKVYNGIVDENDGLDRFTVTWNNWDGSALETDTDVVVNTMPTYDGPTPVKDLGDGVVYHFVGWSPKMNPVVSDTVYTAQFVTFEEDGEAAYGRVLLSENFDGETIDPRLTVSTVGSFTAAPGVKEELGVAGTRAFGFGRSTCGSSAFDNYMTTLTVTFDAPTYVASIAFDEMERYGDWGSQGRILVDGTVVDGLTFTKPGSGGYGNSQEADTEFRHRSLTLNMPLTTLSLQVHDITTSSEEFIDNLRIIGGAYKPHVVLWKNHDGTVLEADADLYEGEIPEYDGATPVRMSDEDGDYLFVGWSPQIGPIVSNTVYTA